MSDAKTKISNNRITVFFFLFFFFPGAIIYTEMTSTNTGSEQRKGAAAYKGALSHKKQGKKNYSLGPNKAVPRRTIVEPSSAASS